MIKFTSTFLTFIFCLSIITGCATSPDKITATYVSPLKYKDYDNDQIVMEMDYIGQRTAELYYQLDKEAKSDQGQMALGLLIFWPALFFLEGGDGPQAAEYARLKGEYEALRKIAIQRKIGLELIPKSPEEIIKDLTGKDKKS
jgi:hypothetical protein